MAVVPTPPGPGPAPGPRLGPTPVPIPLSPIPSQQPEPFELVRALALGSPQPSRGSIGTRMFCAPSTDGAMSITEFGKMWAEGATICC